MKNISLMLRRIIVAATFVGMVAVFTGCRNTAEGVGEDMERAGENIQDRVD